MRVLSVRSTLVQRFATVVDGQEAGSVVPVHSKSETFPVVTVPAVSGSFAVMSTSASGGTKLCPSGGPPPENAGTPAFANGTRMRNEMPRDHAIVATTVVHTIARSTARGIVFGRREND